MSSATANPATPVAGTLTSRKTLFDRVLEALYESRRRQAEREIARCRHLIAPSTDGEF
ncbi:MAG TPA: hypothetical protein VG985_01710 [Xanthobacteraceae bacterium]|nr:hypothetical protein [Xanthobacteraceae bacterium]